VEFDFEGEGENDGELVVGDVQGKRGVFISLKERFKSDKRKGTDTRSRQRKKKKETVRYFKQ